MHAGTSRGGQERTQGDGTAHYHTLIGKSGDVGDAWTMPFTPVATASLITLGGTRQRRRVCVCVWSCANSDSSLQTARMCWAETVIGAVDAGGNTTCARSGGQHGGEGRRRVRRAPASSALAGGHAATCCCKHCHALRQVCNCSLESLGRVR